MARPSRLFRLELLGLLSLTIASGAAAGDCADERTSEPNAVTITQVPDGVRTTLERETAGGSITGIERETSDGAPVYEAAATVGGKKWEIVIAGDGRLISKRQDR